MELRYKQTKIFGTKKHMAPKNVVQKMRFKKMFGPRKCLVQKTFGSKDVSSRKNVGSKKGC